MNELKNEEFKFNDVCEEWLAFKKNKVKQSTYLNYKFIINKHLKSCFENKTLLYFKNYDLNEFIDNLKESLVNKTIRDIISVLKWDEKAYYSLIGISLAPFVLPINTYNPLLLPL